MGVKERPQPHLGVVSFQFTGADSGPLMRSAVPIMS